MKPLLRMAGVIFMFMIVVNFYIILFVAMMNDGVVVVYFNHFGEGIFEYVMYMLLLPLLVISFILNFIEYRKRKEDIKNGKLQRYPKSRSGDYKKSMQACSSRRNGP